MPRPRRDTMGPPEDDIREQKRKWLGEQYADDPQAVPRFYYDQARAKPAHLGARNKTITGPTNLDFEDWLEQVWRPLKEMGAQDGARLA